MLVDTVEHGEYRYAVPAGYKIGGKTGTAQIPVEGRYDASKTIASFVGFAPADDPKFIALVILNQPGTSIYGSETAAPLFFEIAKELLFYYNLAPDTH
jgi:cell division protein FtsI (penicillin-binding protein 3)/stage V sporulation protein D (sporulation-specific penicillin-binding protein)